jgi:NitT/TauT family transport system substrate-binding protein
MRINSGAALNTTSIKEQLDWFKAEKLVKSSINMDTLVDSSYVKTL